MQEVARRMDLNMEVLIPRIPPMGESDSVAEAARTELSSLEIITPAADKNQICRVTILTGLYQYYRLNKKRRDDERTTGSKLHYANSNKLLGFKGFAYSG